MLMRDLQLARKAASQSDVELSISAHSTVSSTQATESHKKGGERMKTMLFGGLDGIITTFAVVAGASGGSLSVPVVLIMGFSSLVADALSMGVGDALSSKAEGEIKEMIDLYIERGIPAEDASAIVRTMAKHKDFFIDVMMRDELGMEPPETSPGRIPDHWVSGMFCFTAFMICGSVPLLGYVAFLPATGDTATLFGISCGLTAATLFLLGAIKSRFTTKTWWHSGAEILIVGAFTAAAAYLIGWGVEHIVSALQLEPDHVLGCNATVADQ